MTSATDSFAQECTFLLKEDGSVNSRFILINGQKHFFAPEEIGRKILSDLATLDMERKRVSLLEEKLELKDDIIDFKSIQIEAAEDRVRILSAAKTPEPDIQKWYDRPPFWFASGVVLASLLFGYWAYTTERVK